MKKNFMFCIAVGATLLFAGCNDDEKKSKITGTWEVTDAMGVEWEEGEGVINTNDPDEEFLGETVTITATQVTIADFGTFDYELSGGVMTIDFGDGETEEFNIAFDDANTMLWSQDDPDDHSDYEYNEEGDNYLFYQKFLTLDRQ